MSFRLLFAAGFVGLALTRRRWSIGSLTVQENGKIAIFVVVTFIKTILGINLDTKFKFLNISLSIIGHML